MGWRTTAAAATRLGPGVGVGLLVALPAASAHEQQHHRSQCRLTQHCLKRRGSAHWLCGGETPPPSSRRFLLHCFLPPASDRITTNLHSSRFLRRAHPASPPSPLLPLKPNPSLFRPTSDSVAVQHCCFSGVPSTSSSDAPSLLPLVQLGSGVNTLCASARTSPEQRGACFPPTPVPRLPPQARPFCPSAPNERRCIGICLRSLTIFFSRFFSIVRPVIFAFRTSAQFLEPFCFHTIPFAPPARSIFRLGNSK